MAISFTPASLTRTAAIGRFRAALPRGLGGAVAALLLGCTSMSQPANPAITGTQWRVVELDGQAVPTDVRATLAIADDGRVSGSDGCNRFVGGLVLEAHGKVAESPSPGISTKMACPGARDGVSRRYNALRGEAVGWRIEGETLVISTVGGRSITLVRPD